MEKNTDKNAREAENSCENLHGELMVKIQNWIRLVECKYLYW